MLTYVAAKPQVTVLQDRVNETLRGRVHVHITRGTGQRPSLVLELCHPEGNKAQALRAWSAMLGCDPRMVTVFGDNLNDLGLFAVAGHRVAVRNAQSELKSLADEVIGSNDEDAVAHYIARHL